ncbi:MAG: hypothetical protein GKR94_17150 [Gammaproteobacteria bacterium]|nr:hypothetical protein [Gammaproteobacteria bacterium]
MEPITQQTLRERYRALNTPELIALGKAGQLTAAARPLLLEELANRGISDLDSARLADPSGTGPGHRERLRRVVGIFILVMSIGLALGTLLG